MRKLVPVLFLALIAIALIVFLARPLEEESLPTQESTPPPLPPPAYENTPPIALPPVVTYRRELPTGVVIDVPSDGVETQLIAFIADPGRPADDGTWFVLDRVVFAEGTPQLTADSEEQLDNLAAILAAWPFVTIEIRGAGGDSSQDMRLARDRAVAVRNALVNRGVTKDRVKDGGSSPADEGIAHQAPSPGKIAVAVAITRK